MTNPSKISLHANGKLFPPFCLCGGWEGGGGGGGVFFWCFKSNPSTLRFVCALWGGRFLRLALTTWLPRAPRPANRALRPTPPQDSREDHPEALQPWLAGNAPRLGSIPETQATSIFKKDINMFLVSRQQATSAKDINLFLVGVWPTFRNSNWLL